MTRKIPQDPPELAAHDGGLITQTRRYKLITPLFGGGVEVQQADPISVVRASEVRGQLRFWWRATRGGQFEGNWERMKAAEDVLWGSTEHPSLVQVALEVTERGNDIEPYRVYQGNNGRYRMEFRPRAYQYGLFPLQPPEAELRDWERNPKPIKVLRRDVAFTLKLSLANGWPKVEKDQVAPFPPNTTPEQEVAAALWAWETFGGLGGRTRRGFGAVTSDDTPLPSVQQVQVWLVEQISQHVVEGIWPQEVPRISRDMARCRIILQRRNPLSGWNTTDLALERLLQALSDFRQHREPDAKPNQPGRSHWPEPDSLRLDTKAQMPYHKPRLLMRKYPRAVFGLPIVTHFKDRGDPSDVTIQGRKRSNERDSAEYDRLGSPLILRPLRCRTSDRDTFVGIALVLDAPRQPPGGLGLKQGRTTTPVMSQPLTQADVEQMAALPQSNKPPLRLEEAIDGSGNVDVLLAFLNYLER